MQTQEQIHHHRHSHHGCCEGSKPQGRGPEIFYGYCHESGRMRMMDLSDYVGNTQTGYSNLASRMSSMFQPLMDTLQQTVAGPGQQRGPGHQHGHEHGAGHHHGRGHESCCHEEHDCHCSCCIRCADAVEYARCDEVRAIPVTFENDSRRERDVKLELGPFVTESGQQMWRGVLSEEEFKLPPCGEKTIIIKVRVTCGNNKLDTGAEPQETPGTKAEVKSQTTGAATGATGPANPQVPGAPAGSTANQQPSGTLDGPPAEKARLLREIVGQRHGTVDSCTVGYATLRAEGCMVRPLVIALAVLPNDCGAHRAGCQCGCCC